MQVSDGAVTDSQSIAVTVTAANDNSPGDHVERRRGTATINVAENATAVTTVLASDADRPMETLTYWIVGARMRRNSPSTTPPERCNSWLRLTYGMPTDADANNIYEVAVAAGDGVTTDVQSVSISVLDSPPPPVVFDDFVEEPKYIYVSPANQSENDSDVSKTR